MPRSLIGLFCSIALLPGVAAKAAPEKDAPGADLAIARYELGRRLKVFEAVWEKAENPAGRKRAAAKLAEVHAQFLTLRFRDAARTLDLAAHAFESDDVPGTTKQWVSSLYAKPEARLVDGDAKELSVEIRQLYPVRGAVPKDLEVQLWFSDKEIATAKPTEFPFTVKVPLPPLGDFLGLDRKLYVMVEAGRDIRRYPIGISQVGKLTDRLAALKKTTGDWKELDTIEKATIRDRVELLAGLVAGGVEETDIPAASLLDNAEKMLDGQPFFTANKPGQYWLSVPLGGKKTAPIRISIPKGLDPRKPVPVVVGLHGAGGTENLFFEGYGAGRAVEECQKRDWVFVATRSGLDFGGGPAVVSILEHLTERYPLDPKRTFLIGHSMGAGQTVALAQKHPGRFAGVACLGGGGSVKDAKAFATLPAFLAAGEKDFALGSTKELNKSLVAGGAKAVSFTEYPGIEHMLIVRVALPDAFEMFEAAAGRR